ncbi:hypothetical protein [Actinocorallia sp. A-T 12471]|uniref:hypothetical protein n=1 Tax=Actinocorallia sp. A-T 12471 TaxID=3089813 RepID=UPI0029CF4F3C|nr:hypothetical protein [Actinocorallia sp. A-T 12471]MDX6742801.1 hypothetical protein [Actinocorallia sp. A-T 12471]
MAPQEGAGTTTLTVHWALWSKQQGTREDFSVLNASRGLYSKAEFAKMLRYFASGNPDSDRSLPRAVLSWVGGKRPSVGFSVQKASRVRDGAGRPVPPTYHFCVPWEQLSARPVAYADLFDALAPLSDEVTEGRRAEPLHVPVRTLDPGRVAELAARWADGFALPAVMTASTLLLGPRQVCLSPDGLGVRSRLDFLDAALALLPYGYRAHFSGGTWASPSARHPLLLFFADRPATADNRVNLSPAQPRPVFADSREQRHIGILREIFGYPRPDGPPAFPGLSDDERRAVLCELVTRLAEETDPRLPDDDHALRVLDGHRRALWAARLPAARTLADARAAFADDLWAFSRLSAGNRTATLTLLIEQGDEGDEEAILAGWARTEDQPWEALAARYRPVLWPAEQTVKEPPLPPIPPHDDYLARLLTPPDDPARFASGLPRAGALLLELADVPGLPDLPKLRAALLGDALDVACECAAQAAERWPAQPDKVRDVLKTLFDGRLIPFDGLLQRKPKVAKDCVRGPLASAAPRVHALLRFTRHLWLTLPPHTVTELLAWFVATRAERAGEDHWHTLLDMQSPWNDLASAAFGVMRLVCAPEAADGPDGDCFVFYLRHAGSGLPAELAEGLRRLAFGIEGEAGGPLTRAAHGQDPEPLPRKPTADPDPVAETRVEALPAAPTARDGVDTAWLGGVTSANAGALLGGPATDRELLAEAGHGVFSDEDFETKAAAVRRLAEEMLGMRVSEQVRQRHDGLSELLNELLRLGREDGGGHG